ncbi:MAG: biotin--[acetyl-CoA-carboxylase] ligase [bacterium]
MQFFDPDIIKQNLHDNQFVQEIHVYQSVTSTNTLAKRLADAGAPSGTLLLAEKQTAGKGRMGREWISLEGVGLWFSLIFRPQNVGIDYRLLPLILSEEIALAIQEHTGIQAGVKWPNDILVDGKKMCGILCESSYGGPGLQYVISGIGINVNHAKSDFPEDLQGIAISLCIDSGRKHNRLNLLCAILKNLEKRFCGKSSIKNDLSHWRRLCGDLGSQIGVSVNGTKYTGIFQDISESGEMIFREKKGKVRKFVSGETTIVKMPPR